MSTNERGVSRRGFLGMAAGLAAAGALPNVPGRGAEGAGKAAVGVVSGQGRRESIRESLVAIEDRILPVLKTKKVVVIKPNLVTSTRQLAATHVDALHGILDFLGPRFKGPVVIAESSAGQTLEAFDHYGYSRLVTEHKPLAVSLVDLNEEGRYQTHAILNGDLHLVPVRLAARLLDPEAFVLCSAVMKTHNTVVATLALKNMALGAPLHSPRKEATFWNDKRIYHGGVRQTHVDIALTAQKLASCWGAAVLDGWEGMEGDGPTGGTGVPSRVAVASTDFVAADRVGLELMGIDPSWVGYLGFCARSGLGQDDLAKIEVRGSKLAGLVKKYKMHADINRELHWQGPLKGVPEKLG